MSSDAAHPREKLVPVLNHPLRFSIIAALATADDLSFRYLRDTLGSSDAVISKQLRILEEAGFVKIQKAFVGKYPRTSGKLTKEGRTAWTQHVGALREITNQQLG